MGQNLRVLLVQVDTSKREALAKLLTEYYHYVIDTAGSVGEAWERVKNADFPYQVVLVDDLLPLRAGDKALRPSGIQLMRQILTRWPRTQAILFTRPGEMKRASEAIETGAFRYLVQPSDPDELAALIQHAADYRQLKGVEYEKEVLEQLLETSPILLGGKSQREVIDQVLTAIQKIGFDRVRLYLRSEDGKFMLGKGQVGMNDDFLALERPIEDDRGMQDILHNPYPHICKRDKDETLPFENELGKEGLQEWICLPLLFQGAVIGALSADKKFSQEPIHEEELGPVLGFVSQAAAAIENARLFEEKQRRAEQLEKLSKATTEIMSKVGKETLDDLLTLIARHVTEILGSEVSGVLLVNRPGWISLRASYGYARDNIEREGEYEIHSRDSKGLTGYIAHTGQTFNEYGDDLIHHPASDGTEPNHLPSGKRYSLLAIPLKKKGNQEEELIGLLRAENKKGANGCALPSLGFTKEDEWILSIFAETVVVAIDRAELMDHQKRLIRNSPVGIMAIDRQGQVIDYNDKAHEILGYSFEEAIGKNIEEFHLSTTEPRKIGKQLHTSKDGAIREHKADLRTKDGKKVSVRFAATWLYNAQKQQIGSVGYFEDLSIIEQIEDERELLMRASNIIAYAEDLSSGIQNLAEMVGSILEHTYCRILLPDNTKKEYSLVVKAASPSAPEGQVPWNSRREESIIVDHWRGLARLLQEGKPKLLLWEEERDRHTLEKLSQHLNLHIQSLLAVPLTIRDRVVGYMELVRVSGHKPFVQKNMEFASAIAAHTVALIDRRGAIEKARQVSETVARVMALGDHRETLVSVAEGTREVIRCDIVVLYVQNKGKFDYPPVAVGLKSKDKEEKDKRKHFTPFFSSMIDLHIPHIVENANGEYLLQKSLLLKDENIASYAIIPMKTSENTSSMMVVAYRSEHHFTSDEMTSIELFANQAAVAIRNAQLYMQVQKQSEVRRALYQAGRAVTESLKSKEALTNITEQVMALMNNDKNRIHRVGIWLAKDGIMKTAAVYPSAILSKIEARWPDGISLNPKNNERIGIVGRALKTRTPQLVNNITEKHPDYILWDKNVCSELAVPFEVDGYDGGIINVESIELDAFDEDDQKALELLAPQAAIAIQNAKHYEDLEHAQGLIGGYIAAAWMGMASATWRHTVGNQATTICDLVKLLRSDILQDYPIEKLEQRLAGIREMAEKIQESPITPSLSKEGGVGSIFINDLIRERVEQLKKHAPYSLIQYSFVQKSSKICKIKADSGWLKQVFDILIDNASEAMSNLEKKELTIVTRQSGECIEILFIDIGKGIPPSILPSLFIRPIDHKSHQDKTKGAGMGLLLASTILQAYEGEIRVDHSDDSGTTLVVSFPLERNGRQIESLEIQTKLLLVADLPYSDWIQEFKESLSENIQLDIFQEKETMNGILQNDYRAILVDAASISDVPELITQVRNCRSAIKLFVVSTSSDWTLARETLRAGATDYITDINAMRSTLARIV